MQSVGREFGLVDSIMSKHEGPQYQRTKLWKGCRGKRGPQIIVRRFTKPTNHDERDLDVWKMKRASHDCKAIRRPLLTRGTKAAAAGSLSFYQLAVIAFQAISLCFVFRGQKYPHNLRRQIHFRESGFITKNLLFSTVFSRLEKSEKQFPRLPKHN